MNFIKLVQIVNYILAKYDYRLNYMKLIKLIYIADRVCLDRYCFAISGDTYRSMKNGPVLENLYNCIKNNNSQYQKEWNKFFDKDGYDLIAKTKSDYYGETSKAEREIIDDIDEKYHNKDEWYLVDEVHKFPEWNKEAETNNTSTVIEKADILKSLGRTDSEINEIMRVERACEEGRRRLLNGV